MIRQSERCEIGGRPLERRACQPYSRRWFSGSWSAEKVRLPGSNYAPSPDDIYYCRYAYADSCNKPTTTNRVRRRRLSTCCQTQCDAYEDNYSRMQLPIGRRCSRTKREVATGIARPPFETRLRNTTSISNIPMMPSPVSGRRRDGTPIPT